MNILITGAAGFVGKNLTATLEAIRDGKDRCFPDLYIEKLWLFDVDTPKEILEEGCRAADFVFHLAGVNRAEDPGLFAQGNVGFTTNLLETMKKYGNTCPVLFASSIQASLEGRYDNHYGRSKKKAEELLFAYGIETGAKVLVYRFPNLFGKWCRPNYNSVVATFCHNIARDLPIQIHDRALELELLYVDDLLEEMLRALRGQVHSEGAGRCCEAPGSYKVTLGEIAELLYTFRDQPSTLMMPQIPGGSFGKKLFSTYLSYLPVEKAAVPLQTHTDERGSFTELLRTQSCGQFSVNIAKPGVTKGRHWHHSKWEFFVVVSGHGLIRLRKLGCDELLEFAVSGEKPEAVYMLPGYTHEIINCSRTENLVTLMWANEPFDSEKPDTYFETVER